MSARNGWPCLGPASRSRRASQTRVGRSPHAARLVVGRASGFASALPEPAGLNGTERTSAGFDRAEALERVAVRRQHLSFRSPLSYFHNGFAKDLWAVVNFYNDRFHINLGEDLYEVNSAGTLTSA
jgi:cytochrome c peroxidase